MTPAKVVTMRGPTLSCHQPPITVPMPRQAIAMLKVSVTWIWDQPSLAISGLTKTLQA